MKVIILAAGIGQRLGAHAAERPKCLLEFGGISLLQRHLRNLDQHQVSEILLFTGFNRESIMDELAMTPCRTPVRTIYNPDFRSGSVISLWHAREALCSGEDIILMDADVLCAPAIINRLFETGLANCFLLDRDFIPGDEPVKLCVHNGRLIDFRKQIDKDLQFDFQGESVGFFRFSSAIARQLSGGLQGYIDSGQLQSPYEEAIRDLLLQLPESFSYEDVTGLPWIEIDFPEDIERAGNEILKQIENINH